MTSTLHPLSPRRTMGGGLLGCILLAWAAPTWAHVKWFSEFSYLTPPLSMAQVLTPTYLGLVALSVATMACLVLVDRRLEGVSWYRRTNEWLTGRQAQGVEVMRLAMAATLLMSWSADAVLAPELMSGERGLIWLQFVVALLLLFPRAVPWGGAGLLAIFGGSIVEFGLFHMLDYLHYLGIGVFLLFSRSQRERLRSLGMPALYATVGFSLIWLAYEKLYYPSWALYLLEHNPRLTMGLPLDFFLQGAAFVEIGLGFLLLIGLLERPLAAVITLVFFSTTLIFGKVEVIGHTPVHAALVVFLLNGAGTLYKPPIAIHRKLILRVLFAAVNYVLIAAFFLVAYSWAAHRQHNVAMTVAVTESSDGLHGTPHDDADVHTEGHGAVHHHGHDQEPFDLTDAATVPRVARIEAVEESPGNYNLHVQIDHWTFTPERAGQASVANEGHGHVYVDGTKVGRLYGEWFHLGALEPGTHRIVVTLNGNDHRDFVVDGQPIQGETTVVSRPGRRDTSPGSPASEASASKGPSP